MTKAEIRAQIAEKRPDFQTLEKLSAAVVKKFQTLELFQQAKTVGVYIPLPDEVDITPLFQWLETNCVGAQTFYIPAYDEALGVYRLAEYSGELKKGKFGIPEPANPIFAPEEIDLILVPGVAFDHSGNRIGRGGGFYDRLLPQYRAVRAGICFGFQCLERIPAEPHDCKMNLIVTESLIS
ncbi:MAG: 5-formyltetrahydrofolate cyclo-ligase [Verrucomicrobia bacterium]|nr:5-formyltetrahydrofolate cyclo-ligase [Verrucomicrobiota bacterium]